MCGLGGLLFGPLVGGRDLFIGPVLSGRDLSVSPLLSGRDLSVGPLLSGRDLSVSPLLSGRDLSVGPLLSGRDLPVSTQFSGHGAGAGFVDPCPAQPVNVGVDEPLLIFELGVEVGFARRAPNNRITLLVFPPQIPSTSQKLSLKKTL